MSAPRWILASKTGLLIAAVATAVVVPQFGGNGWVAAAALAVAFVLMAARDVRANLAGYLAALALQVAQPFLLLRFAVSDLFMLAALGRLGARGWRRDEPLPVSTMFWPFVLTLVAFGVALFVGAIAVGRPSTYVLFNRVAGLLFLMAGFVALSKYMDSPGAVMRGARWFVLGVGVANAAALVAVALSFAGVEGSVYHSSSLRLFGWVGNPSLYGGILMTAGMIELGLLTSQRSSHEHARLRWLNVALMAIALALTFSRSAWLASAVAASALLAAVAVWGSARPWQYAAIGTWALGPALALAGILNANLAAGLPTAESRAADLRKYYSEAAPPVGMPEAAPKRSTADAARTAFGISGSVMNARGLMDRFAILKAAWGDYSRSIRTIVFGIGLGTFFATSAGQFGVPLIIHNTFAWFLIELGPLGLIALLWMWGRTALNLKGASLVGDDRQGLALGLTGAFAGMSAFWLLNEGFYQRHFWLVMLLADRLHVLRAGRINPRQAD